MVNEPSVFEPLKFYCNLFAIEIKDVYTKQNRKKNGLLLFRWPYCLRPYTYNLTFWPETDLKNASPAPQFPKFFPGDLPRAPYMRGGDLLSYSPPCDSRRLHHTPVFDCSGSGPDAPPHSSVLGSALNCVCKFIRTKVIFHQIQNCKWTNWNFGLDINIGQQLRFTTGLNSWIWGWNCLSQNCSGVRELMEK